jgi:AraC-like DNA-binding protein
MGGDAIVIFPNVPHEYFKSDEGEAKSLTLVCNTKLLSEIFPDIVTKYPTDPFVPSQKISQNVSLAFNGITATDDEAQMLGWTYIALSELIGSLTLVWHDGDRELPARVVAYIDENFKEPLTIDYIAKVFGYHPSYIAHVFCDQLKISFRTYLGAVRAEYAAAEIRTTQKSLTEIAYESGCNSLNTFCRCFKKHFSMTPSQYKKSINNKNA